MSLNIDRHVLVVDRNAAWGRHVARALEPAGYAVDWAADLESAMDRLEANRHALAIVDADLGLVSGSLAITALRWRHPSLRVVLTASEPTADHADEAHAVGAFFVPKPLHERALRALVEACLAREV